MRLGTQVVIISLFISVIEAGRNNYRKCPETSFCRRCKSVTGPSKYEVVLSTLYTETTGISVHIVNKENKHLFIMKLKALKVCYVKLNQLFNHSVFI